jgi:hypothetical protein
MRRPDLAEEIVAAVLSRRQFHSPGRLHRRDGGRGRDRAGKKPLNVTFMAAAPYPKPWPQVSPSDDKRRNGTSFAGNPYMLTRRLRY